MQVIKEFLSLHNISAQTYAVGVSGGADSLSLVLMLKEALPECKIIALTVNHLLRPSSTDEAQYVAQLMQKNNIEHHILTWRGKKPKTGIEEAARQARYNLICDWCKKHNVDYLMIAHHLFDQAETFMMRLERGSGLYGLSAMLPVTEHNGITILRPLLEINPERLKEYLNKKNIHWVEDESNQCTDFLRVKMRKFLPELNLATGISAERICLAVNNLQRMRIFIDDCVKNIINNKVHAWYNCGYSVDYREFLSWHDELKFYVLATMIKKLSSQDYTPKAQSIHQLIAKLKADNFQAATLGGVFFTVVDLRLWLIREYRNKATTREEEWEEFITNNPEVNGIKIPYKMRNAIIYEKKHKK